MPSPVFCCHHGSCMGKHLPHPAQRPGHCGTEEVHAPQRPCLDWSSRVVGGQLPSGELGRGACLDLGSNLTLLSEAKLAKMRNPPKVHLAKGFHLKGVTGETRVKGYMNLCLWL